MGSARSASLLLRQLAKRSACAECASACRSCHWRDCGGHGGGSPASGLLCSCYASWQSARRTLRAHVLAGHAIGVIVADTEAAAQAAARAVEVTYTDIAPVLSIEQAIETGSYFEVLLLQGVPG